jgi:hypothetical protein
LIETQETTMKPLSRLSITDRLRHEIQRAVAYCRELRRELRGLDQPDHGQRLVVEVKLMGAARHLSSLVYAACGCIADTKIVDYWTGSQV